MLLNHQKWSLKFKVVGINENELFSVRENSQISTVFN